VVEVGSVPFVSDYCDGYTRQNRMTAVWLRWLYHIESEEVGHSGEQRVDSRHAQRRCCLLFFLTSFGRS
jgi:hypothetical protein